MMTENGSVQCPDPRLIAALGLKMNCADHA